MCLMSWTPPSLPQIEKPQTKLVQTEVKPLMKHQAYMVLLCKQTWVGPSTWVGRKTCEIKKKLWSIYAEESVHTPTSAHAHILLLRSQNHSLTYGVAVMSMRQAKELVSSTHFFSVHMEYVSNSTKNYIISGKKYLDSSVGEQKEVNSGNNSESRVIVCSQGRDGSGFYRWSVVESGGEFTKIDRRNGFVGQCVSWAHCPGSRGKPVEGCSTRRLRNQEKQIQIWL